MNDKVEAIVLKQTDYQDNSILITVLTKEYGKLSFVARSAKKINSKNASAIQLYTRSELLFDYRDNKTIFNLKTAKTLDYYNFIHEDLVSLACAGVLAQICDLMILDINSQAYEDLAKALKLLNEKENPDIIMAVFIARRLNDNGLAMQVDECINCGSKLIKAFSVKEGGFLCEECAHIANEQFLSVQELRTIRLLNKMNFDNFGKYKQYVDKNSFKISTFIDFFEYHSSLKLSSFAFYRSILPLNEAS